MRKKNRLVAIGAVGAAGLAIAGASLLPASAGTDTNEKADEKGATTEGQSFTDEAATRIRSELDELVEDGTLTEDEADAVAETLAEALAERGPGGRGDRSGDGSDMPQGEMPGGDMPQGGPGGSDMPGGDMPQGGPDSSEDGFGPGARDEGADEDDSTTDDQRTEREGRGGPKEETQDSDA